MKVELLPTTEWFDRRYQPCREGLYQVMLPAWPWPTFIKWDSKTGWEHKDFVKWRGLLNEQ